METLTFILAGSPYGDEKVWNALRLAEALASTVKELKLNIFLLGDAVTMAKKGQKPPQGYYNLENMLKTLIQYNVNTLACITCMKARGLEQNELVEGIQAGTMIQLAKWVIESQKVIQF